MAAVPRRTSLRSSTVDSSLPGHQHVTKLGTRKALGDVSNHQTSLLGPGKVGAKKALGKPVGPSVTRQAEKKAKGLAVLQERQVHVKKPSQYEKPLLVEEPKPVCAVSEPSQDVGVPETTIAFSQQLQIDDIDSADQENPQLCAEYVVEIYSYMLRLEKKYMVSSDFLVHQREITSPMRCVLIDWLIQVQQRFKLLQETLYVTVSIIDRYLSLVSVQRSKLQLVGVTAMLIASKYEETYAPMVEDFVFVTDRAYSQIQIRAMEGEILKTLDFELGKPFCLQFLRRNSKAGSADALMHTVAKYLMELTLPEAEFSSFVPSQVAAAALYLTMKLLGRGSWNATVEHYSGCTERQLRPCAQKMATLLSRSATEKKTMAVRNKYAASAFMSVSKMLELQPASIAASGLLR